jgi:hypothetical protein
MLWNASDRLMGGFKCAELGEGGELTLAGPKGEIWRFSDTHYRAVRFLPSGDEQLVTFPNSHLNTWRKRLEVPLDPHLQAIYANNFHKDVSALVEAYFSTINKQGE